MGVFAGAGYLTVAIAHEGRTTESYEAVCDALAVEADPCAIKISWDRPHDVARVLDWLEAQAESPDNAGLIDLTRIAHVGHSAGGGAALMSMGATRNFVCAWPFGQPNPPACDEADLTSLVEQRFAVGVALSPPGPSAEGFMDTSYGMVTRPVLMATGLDDGDTGEPAVRLAIWPLLPAGDKFKLYVDDVGAVHTLFEGKTDACEKKTTAQKCDAMRKAIFATGLAFLDAHLRDRAEAKAWLASEDLVTGGAGTFTFERK